MNKHMLARREIFLRYIVDGTGSTKMVKSWLGNHLFVEQKEGFSIIVEQRPYIQCLKKNGNS